MPKSIVTTTAFKRMKILVWNDAKKTTGSIPVKARDIVNYYGKMYDIPTPFFRKDTYNFVLSEFDRLGSPIHVSIKINNAKKRINKKSKKKYKDEYYKYIDSAAWQKKRIELFELRGKKCERCGSIKKIQVHHKTYTRLYKELMEDLEVLCETCHKKHHNIK